MDLPIRQILEMDFGRPFWFLNSALCLRQRAEHLVGV